MSAHRPTPRDLKVNAALTLVLLCAIFGFGTSLTERFVRARVDLSEDGLYELSDATRGLVARIEDPVSVRVYVSERIDDGAQALRAARIRSQLGEIVALRPGSFDVRELDPTRSSAARDAARAAGFSAQLSRSRGLGGGGEEVWLSIELGYRGRQEFIPVPRPFEFEVQFASALDSLLSDRRIGIGWYGASIDPVGTTDQERYVSEGASTFRYVREALSRRGRFERLANLSDGRMVPDDIDVLFLVRPGAVDERAAYAIDQFVQRGGRLIACLDAPDYNVATASAVPVAGDVEGSPLRGLFASWGAFVHPEQVWDDEYGTRRQQLVFGAGGQRRFNMLDSPVVLTVPNEGLSDDLPPTRGLEVVQLAWAHPLAPDSKYATPPGVRRTDMIWSSERAWRRPIGPRLPAEQRAFTAQLSLMRNEPAMRFPLAAVFYGRFPSPWAGGAAPAPAEAGGLAAPDDEPPPRSAEVVSQVVVLGDADWLRDPAPEDFGRQPFAGAFGSSGIQLALNLVDWLVLDEDLIELRSRSRRLRPLRDFVAEEAEALGVLDADPYQTDAERLDRARKLDRARARATRTQWLLMLAPAGGALLVVFAFGLAWNLVQRPRGRAEGGRGRGGAA